VSGAQFWNGTADTLKAKPTSTKTMPSDGDGFWPNFLATCVADLARRVEPVPPKMSDMP
jgi:hypothetical protein